MTRLAAFLRRLFSRKPSLAEYQIRAHIAQATPHRRLS